MYKLSLAYGAQKGGSAKSNHLKRQPPVYTPFVADVSLRTSTSLLVLHSTYPINICKKRLELPRREKHYTLSDRVFSRAAFILRPT